MKNTKLEKYIIDLENKKKRLEFELAEVNDELESIVSKAGSSFQHNYAKECSLCNGIGEYNDRWAGFITCPRCGGSGYEK